MLFNPLNLWISLSKSLFISARDLSCPVGAITLYFICHVNVMSLKLVSNYAIVTCFTDHIASHMNQCFSSSSLPIPWNANIPRGRIIPCLIGHTWNGTWSSSLFATWYYWRWQSFLWSFANFSFYYTRVFYFCRFWTFLLSCSFFF